MSEQSFFLADEQATLKLGAQLSAACGTGAIIYLHGDLRSEERRVGKEC